jgi:hypothetical protein
VSIVTYRTVRCDTCGIESDAGSTPAEARRIAKHQGWARRKDSFAEPSVFVDLCPNCAAGAGVPAGGPEPDDA